MEPEELEEIITPPQTQSQLSLHGNSRLARLLDAASSPLTADSTAHENRLSSDSNNSIDVQKGRGKRLKAQLRRLRDSEPYNITILCHGKSFRTTADLLTAHSSYFNKTIAQGNELPCTLLCNDQELLAVERFMDFVYNFKYFPRTKYSTPSEHEPLSDLEIHIAMHKLAVDWGVALLKSRAKSYFECQLFDIIETPNVEEILHVVPRLYDKSEQGMIELQKLLVTAWAKMETEQIMSMDQVRLRELYARFPDFAMDLNVFYSQSVTPKAPEKRMRLSEGRVEVSPTSRDS